MDYIIFNSLLNSTLKKDIWLNIRSATYDANVEDYIIEYKVLYGDRKIKIDNFLHSSYLRELGDYERMFITQMIKLRTAIIDSYNGKKVVTEVTII